MNKFVALLAFVAAILCMAASEPITPGLLGLAILKIGAIKIGAAIGAASSRRRGGRGGGRGGYGRSRGGRGRHGRSLESEKLQEVLLRASLEDVDDCAKTFVCQLSTKPVDSLDEFEQTIFDIYGDDTSIDVTRTDVEFQLASNIGRLAGEKQCQTVYARCPMKYDQLLETIEGTFPQQYAVNQF